MKNTQALNDSEAFFRLWQEKRQKEQEQAVENAEALGFKLPTVRHLAPIPADSNPFHHDSQRMGTPLVRGWIVMHEGFDSKENPYNLTHVVLINQRTGQRIMVDMSSIYPQETEEAPAAEVQ